MIPPGLPARSPGVAAAVCVVVLLALLVERELIRAYSHGQSTGRYLNVALVPLAVVTLTVFLVRVAAYL